MARFLRRLSILSSILHSGGLTPIKGLRLSRVGLGLVLVLQCRYRAGGPRRSCEAGLHELVVARCCESEMVPQGIARFHLRMEPQLWLSGSLDALII